MGDKGVSKVCRFLRFSLIRTINYIIYSIMNTDNCQHLTKYRLFAVMRIPICLLAIILAGSGMATAQVSPFVEYGATVHTGDNIPLWQVSNQQGLGSIYDNTDWATNTGSASGSSKKSWTW